MVRPVGVDVVVLRAEHPGQRPDDYTGHGGDGFGFGGGLRLLEMAESTPLADRARRRIRAGVGFTNEDDLDSPLRALAVALARLEAAGSEEPVAPRMDHSGRPVGVDPLYRRLLYKLGI